MDRLTQETPKGASLIISENQSESDARKELMQKFRLAVESLAAYEQTNLTPADIAAMQAENKQMQAEIADLRGEIERGEIERGEMVRNAKQTEPTKGWVYDSYNKRPTEVIVRTREVIMLETWVTDTQGQFQTMMDLENIYPTKEALMSKIKP